MDHYFNMAILALCSQKSPKGLGRISETRAAFQGLTDSLSEKNSGLEKAGGTGLETQRNAIKIYEVQQENGP